MCVFLFIEGDVSSTGLVSGGWFTTVDMVDMVDMVGGCCRVCRLVCMWRGIDAAELQVSTSTPTGGHRLCDETGLVSPVVLVLICAVCVVSLVYLVLFMLYTKIIACSSHAEGYFLKL